MTLSENTILADRYKIEKLLGEGGMGAIYQGYDTNLDMPVAIKENFFQTAESVKQFQLEARILARLHHPNLPRVIHHFSHNGQHYLVMDFVEGQDLWEIIKQANRPLPEEEATAYIIQICNAVSYLHQQKPPIIHRDIKPQNIKVTPNGRAVLVDFGIAKMAEADSRTLTGAQGVTPGFSPPEQYSGSGTNPASDIYALGATLYALLTAEKPPDSISLLVNQSDFKAPAELNDNLTPHVSDAIVHAMKPQPPDRPQSVAAWQAELAGASGGSSAPTAPPTREIDSPTVMVSHTQTTTQPQSSPVAPTPQSGKKMPGLWIGFGVVIIGVALFAFFKTVNNPTPNESVNIPTSSEIIAEVATPTQLTEIVATEAPSPTDTPVDEGETTPPPTEASTTEPETGDVSSSIRDIMTGEETPSVKALRDAENAETFEGEFPFDSEIEAAVLIGESLYFFREDETLRYNIAFEDIYDGYPISISDDWPGLWADDIEASLNWFDSTIYLFRGEEYIAFDLETNIVDEGYPRLTSDDWPGLWTDGDIDAATLVVPLNKVYFFKGDEYLVYDVETDQTDPGYPRLIEEGLPGLAEVWDGDIDVAFSLDNELFLFQGDEYLIYDIETDEVESDFPLTIADEW